MIKIFNFPIAKIHKIGYTMGWKKYTEELKCLLHLKRMKNLTAFVALC